MNGRALELEEFRIDGNVPGSAVLNKGVIVSGQKMAGEQAYERGYAAGWDDANRTAAQEQTRISTEFAHNLHDLTFTFHEARSHVLRSMIPLLEVLVSKVFPPLVEKAIGPRLLEELQPFMEHAADAPVVIMVAPACRAAMEALLSQEFEHPFELQEETSLLPGQLRLVSGNLEMKYDPQELLSTLADMIETLGAANKEAFVHG